MYHKFMGDLNAEAGPSDHRDVIHKQEFVTDVWPRLAQNPEQLLCWVEFHEGGDKDAKEAIYKLLQGQSDTIDA